MNRHHLFRSSRLVRLGLFDHPGGEPHVDPIEEEASGWSVNLVCAGSFRMEHRHEQHVLGPHSVFVTRPGLVYRCRHDEEYPTDVCMTLDFSPELALEAIGDYGSSFTPVRSLSNRLGYLRFRLEKGLRTEAPDLLLEEIAVELLHGVGSRSKPGRVYQGHSLTWYAQRIDRVRDLLESEYASSHALADLAREARLSPFHLVRVFRDMVGVPPHRFLTQVRLAKASHLLLEGRPVSETALACGFPNLSHFVRMFGKVYGASPGRYARRSRASVQHG